MSPEHSPEFSGCVVVMDDNIELRQMLALALETAGFDVFEAGTRLELQRHLARVRPDALIIDLQRSEAEGLAVLTHMRARAALNNVPILFLAGCDAEDFRRQAMDAGADWFGLRPLGMIELSTRVAELIHAGRPRRRAPAGRPVQLKRTG